MKFPLLAYIDLFSYTLPLAGGLVRIRMMRKPMLLFFLLVVTGGIVEVTSFVMGRNGIHNLWLLQLYHLIDYVFIILVLTTWQKPGLLRSGQRFTIIFYTIFWFIAKITFEPLTTADQYTNTTACILILVTTIITIFQLVKDEQLDFLRESMFWIAGGVLLYFAGNFLLFSVFEKLTLLSFFDAVTIWSIHWGINVIVNLIYMCSFLLLRR